MAWATYRSPSCVVHCASLKVGGKLDRKVGKHPMFECKGSEFSLNVCGETRGPSVPG
jgi:hypothetical protein